MNNPNPLIPQGSLLEQQAKGKPHLRIALFIVAVHVVFLGLLLMQGCKREPDAVEMAEAYTNDFALGPLDRETLFSTTNVPSLDTAMGREPDPVGIDDGDVNRGGFNPQGVVPPTNATPPPPPVGTVDVPPPAGATSEPRLVTREHVVVKGDTFYTIGKKYGVTTAAIAAANPNVNPVRMQPGEKLIIPPPPAAKPAPQESLPPGVELYEVRAGDTLSGVARTHGTTTTAIRRLNDMTTDRIYAGQKLKLPAATNAATTP